MQVSATAAQSVTAVTAHAITSQTERTGVEGGSGGGQSGGTRERDADPALTAPSFPRTAAAERITHTLGAAANDAAHGTCPLKVNSVTTPVEEAGDARGGG